MCAFLCYSFHLPRGRSLEWIFLSTLPEVFSVCFCLIALDFFSPNRSPLPRSTTQQKFFPSFLFHFLQCKRVD